MNKHNKLKKNQYLNDFKFIPVKPESIIMKPDLANYKFMSNFKFSTLKPPKITTKFRFER